MNRYLILIVLLLSEIKSQIALYRLDISATWLSQWDPVGFPPHLRRWFSIVDYRQLNDVLNLKSQVASYLDQIFRRPGYLKETL